MRPRSFKPPRWRSDDPLTDDELRRQRDEFWDTEPHYGGDRGQLTPQTPSPTPSTPSRSHSPPPVFSNCTVIWEALRAACEADLPTAKLIIESAGIIVAAEDMTVCYDERGSKYELPKYVLSDPVNLIRSKNGGQAAAAAAQVEMAAAAAPGGEAMAR